jgi:hypothetical protein
MRRMLLAVGVCGLLGSCWGQVTSATLNDAFGNPSAGLFEVAPGVHMIVSYGRNDEVCVLTIRPDTLTDYSDREATSQLFHELLEKAVPPDLRGTKKIEMLTINGCSGERVSRYQNLNITETIFSDINPTCKTQMHLEVRFLKQTCGPAQK